MKRVALFAAALTCLFALWQFPSISKADDGEGATEALDEVNAIRAARGLPPYVRDDSLTAAAARCAEVRAARLTPGHTTYDFAALPAGATADAAGCAAWHPSMGWGACCTFDRYPFAGAAFAYGRDGKRYMHLFVSSRPNQVSHQAAAAPPAPAPVAQSACAGGSCQGGGGGMTSGRLVIRFGEWPLGHAVANRVTHPFGGRFRR